jgi:protein OS-9
VESGHPTYSADFSSPTDLTNQIRESTAAEPGHDTEDGAPQVSETYEIMNFPPSKYLCSIPVLAPPEAQNQTATDIAKAEEARELARAAQHGWELMNGLEGECLYFMSGWWSYSFCYGKEIVQFHALPTGMKAGVPPVRDPQSLDYVLGRVPEIEDGQRHKSNPNRREAKTIDHQKVTGDTPATTGENTSPHSLQPPNSELAVKDNQRYLVQRLDGGTVCDLTGRDRTIEVQYHCHPGALGDRIGWIKEVTTCTYLMVVQTPRLCHDVAFMPPKEGRAHPVECHRIADGTKVADNNLLGGKAKEAGEGVLAAGTAAAEHMAEVIMGAAAGLKDNLKGTDPDQKQHKDAGLTIGGVVIGGRAMLEDGARLPPPRHHGRLSTHAKTMRQILAKGEGKQQIEAMTREQLQKLELDPKTIEALKEQVQELAGNEEWILEVIEVPGEIAEIRGVVGREDDPNKQEYVQEKRPGQEKRAKPGKNKGSDKERDENTEEGSEETFKGQDGA